MRTVSKLFWLIICGCLVVHAQSVFSVHGTLEFVDLPPAATPVEGTLITLRPLDALHIPPQGNPDRQGAFVLRRVIAGRYALEVPIRGRIIGFSQGSQELAPNDFALGASNPDALRIVVSLKSVEVLVEAIGVPSNQGKRVVVLAPADSLLTLRESCFYNQLVGSQTKFRYVSPGTYRAFVVDQESANDIAVYAPRFPEFLRDRSAPFKVSEQGETKVRATYVDSEMIRQAVREIGPVP